MNEQQIIIRPACDKDVGFILNSWLKSYRPSDANKLLGNDIYYTQHHAIFTKLLQACKVLVACADDDRDQILGYSITGSFGNVKVVVYVYTKFLFRQMGVANRLISAAGINLKEPFFYTYLSQAGHHYRKKYPHAVYNYFLVSELIQGVS